MSFLRRLLTGAREADQGRPGYYVEADGLLVYRATQNGPLVPAGGGGAASPLTLTAGDAAETPLTVEATASQSADLQAWSGDPNGDGIAPQLVVDSDGQLAVLFGGGITMRNYAMTGVHVSLSGNGNITIVCQAGQTGFLVQDSVNAPIFRVDEDGTIHGKTGGSVQFDLP